LGMPAPSDAKSKRETAERDFEREYELDCYAEMSSLLAQSPADDSSDNDE